MDIVELLLIDNIETKFQYDNTWELSCSDDNLNVEVILRDNTLAWLKPKENKLISAIIV